MDSCMLPILAQAADTAEAPLYFALMFGYAPAALGFIVDCVRRRGLSPLRTGWMLVFLGLIFGGWRALFVVDALVAEQSLRFLIIGSAVIGIGTGICFLLPQVESERGDHDDQRS